MFIKKVVASLGTLSLVTVGLLNSGSVLAAQADQDTSMTSLKDRVSQMESTLATLSQTSNRDVQQNPNWSQYIRLSGGLNVDAKLAGSLGQNVVPSIGGDATTAGRFTGENVRRLGVNDAFLNIDVTGNDWVNARLGFTYSGASMFYSPSLNNSGQIFSNNLDVDQAYMTIANFAEYPYYGRVGLQYVDYGVYDLRPIAKPFTQVLTQLNDVALQAGFMDESGLRGSAFIVPFSTIAKINGDSEEARNIGQINYGASFGYVGDLKSNIDYVAKVGYLANIVGLDVWRRDNVTAFGDSSDESQLGTKYHTAVPGVAINLTVKTGPFDAGMGYAGATKAFSNGDLIYQEGKNAKPTATSLSAGYSFKFWENRDNRIGVGYDRSWQASPFGLPKDRYSVNYSVDVFKNANLTLQWDHDVDYGKSYLTSVIDDSSLSNGEITHATGKNFNVVTARLGVNFG